MINRDFEQRSLGDLFSDLASQTQGLVRDEVELAKLEMKQKAKLVGKDVAMVGVGAGVTAAGGMVLLAALVLVLGLVMPYWAAALLVGGVFAAVGVGVAFAGLGALKRIDPAPRQTIQTMKENKAWLRAELAR